MTTTSDSTSLVTVVMPNGEVWRGYYTANAQILLTSSVPTPQTRRNHEAPEPFKKMWQRYEHADPAWLLGVWERTREPYVAPTLGKQEWE